nr:MAG TPA: Baseplate component [Caudoviricetes sp.]
MYKRDIYLDIDDNLNNYIKSVELDSNSRVWHFHLTVDYEPLDLTGKSVQFRAEKPDKTNVLNDCKIVDAEKGVVEVKLTRQVNAIPGHVKCLLKIIGDEGFVLKTKTFVVDVSKTMADDAIVSSDEFGALEAALGKVQDIDNRFAQTNAQLSIVKGTTVSVVEFGAIGDGFADDTKAFQRAIDYCLLSLGGNQEKNVIEIPAGKYKITKTITTYPQIKLTATGFVQIESYIANGSVFYLRFPEGKMHLGCDYRGFPINGNGVGILFLNKLYTGTDAGITENLDVFNGNNVAIELGTRVADDNVFSDVRMVSRYGLQDILIHGFKTGMQLNGISHFMGHYKNVRIKLCDTCVQVGEFQGQDMGTSHENFNFDSCLFERSNNVIKWVRNGVGLVFNNSSFDYIRDNLMIAKYGGQRRVIFNNGHIEKIKNYLFLADYTSGYNAINTVISFQGVELHLKYGELFKHGTKCNSKTTVSFDNCAYLRDEYYTKGYPENQYHADNRKMGDSNTYFNKVNYVVFENKGVPTTGLTAITNHDFRMVNEADTVYLFDKGMDYLDGFSKIYMTGAREDNGMYSITKFGNPVNGWEIQKQLNYQMASDSSQGYIHLTTDKIDAKSLLVSVNYMIRCNDYTNSLSRTIIKCYDRNGVELETISRKSDHTQEWGNLTPYKWCLFTNAVNTYSYRLSPQTSYITVEIQIDTTNTNAEYNLSNLLCEFH